MNRKTFGLLGAVAVAAATAVAAIPAGAFGGAHAAATHTVTLNGVRFHPATLTVNRGDSVRWAWQYSESEHNVTFHGLHSRTGSSGSFTVRFSRAGTFAYRARSIEEGMRGKVIVH